MAGKTNHGFTIIEVMLFLGISSALFVALIGGVSANINFQRYRDSVASLVGTLQQQYSEVDNTRNERDGNWKCSGSVAEQELDGGQARGTTECVVLGRYVRTTDNGSKLEVGSILGTVPPASAAVPEGDTAALVAYAPRVATYDQETKPLEWDAVLRTTDGHPANFSMVILRSPLSGLVRTYAVESAMPNNVAEMMTADAAKQKLTECVISGDWLTGATQALLVDAAISGANGVSSSGDTNEC